MSAQLRNRNQLASYVTLHGHDLLTALSRLADFYDEEAHTDGPGDDCDDSCCYCDDAREAESLRETKRELKELLDRM